MATSAVISSAFFWDSPFTCSQSRSLFHFSVSPIRMRNQLAGVSVACKPPDLVTPTRAGETTDGSMDDKRLSLERGRSPDKLFQWRCF